MADPLLLPDRDARQRLIDAGLEIFGTYNLEGATTRQLAEHAGVNQAAIPYYFGGKEGLYFAVIEHLFSTNFAVIGPVVIALHDVCTRQCLSCWPSSWQGNRPIER